MQRNLPFRVFNNSSHISDNELMKMSSYQISKLDPSQVGFDMVNRNKKYLTEDQLDALFGVLREKDRINKDKVRYRKQQKFEEDRQRRLRDYDEDLKGRPAQIRQWEMDHGERYPYDRDPLNLSITNKIGSSIRYGGKTRKSMKSIKSKKSMKSMKSKKSMKSMKSKKSMKSRKSRKSRK
jgi:hypothetical protein